MVNVGQQGKLKENLTELHIIVRTTGLYIRSHSLLSELLVGDGGEAGGLVQVLGQGHYLLSREGGSLVKLGPAVVRGHH